MTPSTCGTFIPFKLWNLKVEEDPLAEKQKWYCWQGHKYKATWGQVVEFKTVGGRLMYAHATVPYSNIQDMRAIWIESKVGQEATAEQIYDRLELIAPQTSHQNIFVHKGAPPAEHGQRLRWFGIDHGYGRSPFGVCDSYRHPVECDDIALWPTAGGLCRHPCGETGTVPGGVGLASTRSSTTIC